MREILENEYCQYLLDAEDTEGFALIFEAVPKAAKLKI